MVHSVRALPGVARLSPPGGVDVFDRVVGDVLPGLLDHGGHGVAHVLFGCAERAQRNVDPQHVAEEPDRTAPTQVVIAGEEPNERHQPRAAHAWRHAGRQFRARHLAAAGAHHAMQVPLADFRRDRRQVQHLMPNRIGVGSMRQMRVTTATRLRVTGDRRFGRYQQPSLRALVPGLAPALLARRALATARRAIRGTVRRRRLARVRGVLPETPSQFGVLSPESLDLADQRLDHRPKVRDLPLKFGDPAIPLVLHTNDRSHRDPPVDPVSCK